MIRDASDLRARDAYFLMIDTIVPRPIAWVATRSADGVANLAPFSFFTGVTSAPPTVVVNLAPRVVRADDGTRTVLPKDTLANLRETGVFVLHVAPREHRSAVIQSARDHAPEVDEIALAGFETVEGTWVAAPRIPSLPVAMECRVSQMIEVGRLPATMVLGEIQGWHIHDALVDADGRAPSARWGPLGRLGVEGYQD